MPSTPNSVVRVLKIYEFSITNLTLNCRFCLLTGQ